MTSVLMNGLTDEIRKTPTFLAFCKQGQQTYRDDLGGHLGPRPWRGVTGCSSTPILQVAVVAHKCRKEALPRTTPGGFPSWGNCWARNTSRALWGGGCWGVEVVRRALVTCQKRSLKCLRHSLTRVLESLIPALSANYLELDYSGCFLQLIGLPS